MLSAAKDLGKYAFAPRSESVGAAKKLLRKHQKLRAFYLAPKVRKPEYKAGKLTIRVEVAIFTYPGKALKGSIPVKLTQHDVSSKDRGAETELIKMAAGRALEKFAKNVDRIQ